jgi:hypothetical protein
MKAETSFAMIVGVAMIALCVSEVHAGVQESVILHFDNANGAYPSAPLVADAKGNLYGAAANGGHGCPTYGCGLIFELSPTAGGGWSQTVLYAFNGTPTDGRNPSSLTFGPKGDLYGFVGGGANSNGAIFELAKGTNGAWTESLIYSFPTQDGDNQGSPIVFDGKGNIFGTIRFGGEQENGAVYELTPQSNGSYTGNLIYQFTDTSGDGEYPFGGVVLDAKGNVYGTTDFGGEFNNYGTVWELMPNGSGGWTESVIYDFTGKNDGAFPAAPLTIDASGNLYGTTTFAGANSIGTAFELSPNGAAWNFSLLYSFGNNPGDGYQASKLIFDAKGNLYGATQGGGDGCNAPGCGVVFQLMPQSGVWKETILHQFESADDGSQSLGGVLIDNAGDRLFGMTQYGGGRYGYGTVFLIER